MKRLALLALALLLIACNLDQGRRMNRGQLLYWTKFYEKTYGTKTHTVRIIGVGETSGYPWCAFSLSQDGQPVVVYDLNCERGQLVGDVRITEKILAKHEVLHEYLGHHDRMCERDANDRPVYRLISAEEACIDRDQAEAEVHTEESKGQ